MKIKNKKEKFEVLYRFSSMASTGIALGLMVAFDLDIAPLKTEVLFELLKEINVEAPIKDIDAKIQALEVINKINERSIAKVKNPEMDEFSREAKILLDLTNDLIKIKEGDK